MDPNILDQSIHHLLEGIITDDEFEALQIELKLNPDAREVYLDHVAFQNALDIHVQGAEQMLFSGEIPLITPPSTQEQSKQANQTDQKAPLKRKPNKTKKPPQPLQAAPTAQETKHSSSSLKFPSLSLVVSWASAAIVIISLAFFFSISLLDTSIWKTGNGFASIQISPGTNIELYNNGKFSPNDLIIPDTLQDVSPGDRIKVTKGVVRLNLANGVHGIIEAPAEFTVHGLKELSLPSGKGWFDVPKKGHGFTVTTKQTKNVDLGTQFGIVAHKNKDDQLTVFEGQVKISSLNKPSIQHVIGAGKTLNCDAAGSLYKTTETTTFLAKLPKNPPHLHWTFDTVSDQGQLRPVGTLANTKRIKSHIVSNSPTLIQGRHGKAISLVKKGNYIRTSWPGLESSSNRTVMLWLKLPKNFTPRMIPIPPLVAWGTPSTTENSEWKLMLHPRNEHYCPSVSLGAEQFHGLVNLPLNEWVHIAVVQRGSSNSPFKLYVNGESHPIQASTVSTNHPPINTITEADNSIPLTIGGSKHFHQVNTVPCAVDDLYIFGDAMDGPTIRHWMLHQSPPPLVSKLK